MILYCIKIVLYCLFIFCSPLWGKYKKQNVFLTKSIAYDIGFLEKIGRLKNENHFFGRAQKNQAYKQLKAESSQDIQKEALHFYYMVRLEPIIKGLHMMYSNGAEFLCEISEGEKKCVVIDEHITFFHERSIACIESMTKKNSIYPLLELFDNFKAHATSYDEQLMRESLIAAFIVYKKKLTDFFADKVFQKRVNMHVVLDYFDYVYNVIDSLPLEDILEALDAAAEELYPILEHYEFDSFMSWEEWLQKYIWLVPILTVKFIYDVLSKLHFIEQSSSENQEDNSENSHSSMDDLLTLLI